MTLILKKFPTHIAKTANKIAPNKYWKINSQGIYSGSIQRFTRAIVMNNMHEYILSEFEDQELPVLNYPVQLQLNIYIPINYGDVARRSGKISWKYPSDDYEPSADEDNIRWIWEKAIKDCISKSKCWKDDTMYWCRGTSSMIHFIDELDDRRIEVSFKKI